MYYFFVWVRSSRYHSSEPLTYSSSAKLEVGAIVQVELQNELVLGVVVGPTQEPRFKTKPIARVYDLPVLPAHLIKLAKWLQAYYPAPLGILTQQLLPANLSEKQLQQGSDTSSALLRSSEELSDPSGSTIVELEDNGDKRNSAEPLSSNSLPKLTADQQDALEKIDVRDTYLVHGRTGSGKTRLYIELAKRAYESGRSSIILTPEISLTAQLASSFQEVFGDSVVVMHSNQAPGERQAAWLRCLKAQAPLIVVGPRSALFSPLAKLGLIVLDESHEAAYKQEQAPQYQTARVAAYLAPLARAYLILGSATPSISDYYLAQQKGRPVIELKALAKPSQHEESQIKLIDMKDRSQFSRSSLLSQPLLEAVETALKKGEQSLIYLNRRGTARLVMCDNCGWQASCPHCDVPLTYHGDKHELRCHSCDFHQPTPASCPVCGQSNVLYKSAGTKAIVAELEKLFPNVRVARFDTDNLKAERFEQNYQTVRQGDVDILVGTQLLAKGLDLPKLSCLGVVLADTSLYLPDFSAQERTYQLISQVLGRIGRGHLAGTAIIQTYHPDHPILKAAINGDYQGFYKAELAERQQFFFPPFCYLLKLACRRASLRGAESAATKLKQAILDSGARVQIEGPAPAFYEKLLNKYQWQLVVKATERSELLKVIDQLPSGWSYDIDPLDLL